MCHGSSSKGSKADHLGCMLAKQVAENTSSGPINVLPKQMKGETFRLHTILVIGTCDSTAVTFTEQLLRSDSSTEILKGTNHPKIKNTYFSS